MATLDTITTGGEKKGSIGLKKTKPVSPILVSSVVLANLSNKRRSIAHTKTKGEVSGGGRKPWRQKGTGRARVGSIRSPLWIGGGVTFGPRKNSNFYKRINKKQKRLVLNDILLKKAEDGHIRVLEDVSFGSSRTKDMLKILSVIGIDDKVLLVLDNKLATSEDAEKIYNSGRNISFLKIINAEKLNAFLVLKYNT